MSRHDEIRERYPHGLSPDQWRLETLLSAGADGYLDPPPVAHPRHPFLMETLMMSLALKGFARQRDGLKGGPWLITDTGRAFAESAKSAEDASVSGETRTDIRAGQS